MASKLRRAPLFGIDSGFALVAPMKVKSKGVFQMECEVTSSPAPAYGGGSRNGMASNGSGVAGTPSPSGRSSSSPGSSSGKSHLHVGFMDNGEVKEKREKYLTAKYGSHQMSLIRKRLSVEMWLYDELQKLYEDPDSPSGSSEVNPEVEIDLDEVLDLEGDAERRKFIRSILKNAKKSQDVIEKFIDDLLEKAKIL